MWLKEHFRKINLMTEGEQGRDWNSIAKTAGVGHCLKKVGNRSGVQNGVTYCSVPGAVFSIATLFSHFKNDFLF